ncbi:CDP-Glycerol:Poly(glycerophosphate) glycerophosphotransferase family [marine gamma proteobacterium HTCC2148]|jgi:CDP-glycerol glycerophosphotransferase (TagB/SpsB family)|nr:CDP-Glycerol:Poly(glycerophosphate) glycerophosphotransferase family [marine gamma proteobacterium HTCC2148]
MKINNRNPSHWLYLLLFTITVVAATFIKLLRIKKHSGVCLLYGHKLNGNLKALYDFNLNEPQSKIDMRFLTMDPAYCKELQLAGFNPINGINPLNALTVASAFAIVSDHGLHSLKIMLKLTNIPFFDVWHAIPLKGFDEEDFSTQRQYEMAFVTSNAVRSVYQSKFGFNEEKLVSAGYARTDILVNQPPISSKIRDDLGISESEKKILLFAPTWQQGDPNRNILPFDKAEDEFFGALELICAENNALCIFRTHLNSGESDLSAYPSILFRPHSRYPNTEEILLITDCLVSDWSSIVFDFMLLDRPTIFLDVPHPFKKGFSLGPENRFGKLVQNLDELTTSLGEYLDDRSAYKADYGIPHAEVKRRMYDNNADGRAAERICGIIERYR